jgi:putative transposase
MVLRRHAGASRFAYNQCLAMVRQQLDARSRDRSVKVAWTGFDLINAFNGWKRSAAAGRVFAVDPAGTAAVVATGLAWRGRVCQQVFEEAAVDLGRALAAFGDSRRGKRAGRPAGFPRFKRKTSAVASFRLRQKTSAGGRGGIRLGEQVPRTIRLPGIGVLRVREDTRRLRRMLAKGRASILWATVTCRAGRWSVSLSVRAADLHPAAQHPAAQHPAGGDPSGGAGEGGWVGVDRGLTAYVVAATNCGREVLRVDDPPRPMRAAKTKLRRLSRQVTRKRKGSANRGKAVARLGRCHRHIRQVRQHFLHQVANQLVQTHDRLALEDLHITGMMANHRLAGAIGDAAWAELARLVSYKQAWRGGQLVFADRWFPSTKTCSTCHSLAPPMRLSARMFRCDKCGYRADRDLNAAINLATWAEQQHARVRDPEARGPVTNACRGDGPDPHHHVGETSPNDAGTPPTPTNVLVRTPEKGGVS